MNKIVSFIKSHKGISIVLIIGFCVSVAYAFYFKVNITVDAQAYDSIAWSLVQGTGYTETTSPLPESAIGRLGPGYEFFLAFWYFIFGHQVWLIWIIQSIIHVASGFLVYLLLKDLYAGEYRERWAVLGAAFYIFFIDLLEFPAMLLTETLYLFLILLGLRFALRMWRQPTYGNVALTSALLALALLVRPPVAILMFFMLGFLLFRKHWKHAALFIVVSVLLLAPWTIRNYLKYDRFIVTSAILGYDVWVGNSPDSKHIGELTASEEIDRYTTAEGLFAANERGTREVLKLALHHPVDFMKLQLTKTSIYFSAARPAAFWFHLSGISQFLTIIFSCLFAFVALSFGLAGLWGELKKRSSQSWFLILSALAAPAGIIWVVAETRYRYQFYPLLIVLGVLFLAEFMQNKKMHTKILAGAVLLVASNTVLDIIRNIPRVLERIQRL